MDAMSWPSFLAWQYGWLFLLVAPLVVFYFLKLRTSPQAVPSLMLWQQVINDQRVTLPSSAFQTQSVIAFAIVATDQLDIGCHAANMDRSCRAGTLLAITDRCLSQYGRTRFASGLSRLDLAKKLARNVIDNLLPDQQVSLIAVTSTGQRLTSFTNNKREFAYGPRCHHCQDVPSELDDALRMTQAMARSARIESVMW